jgi:branched-chain amino acid transport system permease protein
MALILGIVGIVNLAHGEFLMVGAYLAYFFNSTIGIGPLAAIVPVVVLMVALGIGTYRVSIRKVLAAPELNQLLLTFGISMVLSQLVNLIATSQPRSVSMNYATASATIGTTSFGVFDFIYDVLAVVILVALELFLKKTRSGKAAVAVGQNPKGARIVGINVDRTYLLVFSIAIGILGILGPIFLVRHSIFPAVGGSYTMKSFSLVAMAGIGNLGAVLWCSLALGIAEAFIKSFQGYGDWSDIVFFAMIIIVILVRARRKK